MHIRQALITDVKRMHEILSHYADQSLLLPRSLSELYGQLRDFYVLEDARNRIVHGLCGLSICWEDLAEIKSLAVSEEAQDRGFGSQLVGKCLDDASRLGLKKVFVLTYVPDFFLKVGFTKIKKAVLPHKIWADCLKCPKFPDCDETALMINLPK